MSYHAGYELAKVEALERIATALEKLVAQGPGVCRCEHRFGQYTKWGKLICSDCNGILP